MDYSTRPIKQPSGTLAITLDRSSGVPLFEQLCQNLRDRMTQKEMVEGQKLPPTRAFATELGVSRMTVVNAYEQLVAEGFVHSKRGSGHHVAGIGEIEHNNRRRSPTFKKHETKSTPRRTFNIGKPDMRLFPQQQWAKTVARVCRNAPDAMLSCDDPLGRMELREAVALHVSQWRGIAASPDQIIITPGSTDAHELCIRALTQPEAVVALENPGYQPIRQIALANGHMIHDLEIDDQGATLPLARSHPQLAVLTPSHQFPLGGAMSAGRRRAYKDWAIRQGSWIVEDDYDSEFRFSGQPIPAMASFEKGQRTIYVGSFSKIFSNTLRIGYVIAPTETMGAFKVAMTRFRSKAGVMPQRPLAEFITNGDFYRHLRRVRRIYAERRRFLLERLTRDFSDVGIWADFHAGMHVVLKLKDGHSDAQIACDAAQVGLSVAALSSFSAQTDQWNGLAIGYCSDTLDELEDGLEKLRKIIM